MYIWKALKIFISSTFLDLELERDKLGEIFQRVKEDMASRRLSLIPYDLRWRERHSEYPIARWCIEMIRQCSYFVGILGFRYGWQPPEDAQGKPNIAGHSITEMEIREALQSIPRERRSFFVAAEDCRRGYQTNESEASLHAMESLKQHLRQTGERVRQYQDIAQLLSIIEEELRSSINRDYPPQYQVEFEEYTRQQALSETIDQKISGFVGRHKFLKQLEEFARGSDNNYLVLSAVAGTGKSALLAKFICNWENQYPAVPIIKHFMSMGGDSRQLHGMILNLVEQLQRLNLFGEKPQEDPVELRAQLRTFLEQTQTHLIVAIDGLDEIEESARELTWFSRNFPANVRLIITTRPVTPWDRLQSYSRLKNMELPPLQESEIIQIIEDYSLTNSGRGRDDLHLNKTDVELLSKRAAGNPLYLKVALEEILSSGIAVGQLATSIEALFGQILQRLHRRYGMEMIEAYLGLIAASREGLTETELQELLSREEMEKVSIVDDLMVSATKALSNFLVRRRGLLHFFHPEFERSIKERLGKSGMREYHRRLATYFQQKGFAYARALFELCYQEQRSQQYETLLRTLTNFDFLEAKCSQNMADDLVQDFIRAVEDTEVPLPASLCLEYGEGICVSRRTIRLLGKALKLDLQFLRRHPQYLFQSLWNRCYWYDAPQTEGYYEPIEAQTELPPWKSSDDKIYRLVENWREIKEKSNLTWLKSCKPLEVHLDSPLLRVFKGHEGWVTSVSLNPSSTIIASGSHDAKLRLWDLQTGECLQIIEGHRDKITSVGFSPDGKFLVSASEDKTVRIWNVENGSCVRSLENNTGVGCVVWDDKGQRLASSDKGAVIRIWDVATGSCLQTLEGHEDEVASLAFSPNGKQLLSGSSDKTMRVWDLENNRCRRTITSHLRRVYGVAFSSDGKYIASASRDDTACIWNAQTGDIIHKLEGHKWGVLCLAFSHDGTKLVTGSGDKTMRIWDVNSGSLIKTLCWHERSVASVQFTHDGKRVVSSSYDKTVRLWDAESKECPIKLKEHEEWVRNVTFNTDGTQIASGSTDKKICIWDGHSGKWLKQLQGHAGWVTALCFTRDGRKLISGSGDNTIRIWDLSEQNCVQVLKGHTEPVLAVMLIEDKWLVSGSRDNKVCLWNLEDGLCTRVFQGHEGWVASLDFDPINRRILSASHDSTVRVWDMENGACLYTIKAMAFVPALRSGTEKNNDAHGMENHILTAAFQNNGKEVIFGIRRGKWYVYDLASNSVLRSLDGEIDAHEIALPNTLVYTNIQELHTSVISKATQQPVAFFPERLACAKISSDHHITGLSQGTYIYLLQIIGALTH